MPHYVIIYLNSTKTPHLSYLNPTKRPPPAYQAMGTLVEVSMPQNGITHTGITALSEALSFNRNLQILNLSDNTFTVKGSRSIAKVHNGGLVVRR